MITVMDCARIVVSPLNTKAEVQVAQLDTDELIQLNLQYENHNNYQIIVTTVEEWRNALYTALAA